MGLPINPLLTAQVQLPLAQLQFELEHWSQEPILEDLAEAEVVLDGAWMLLMC